MVNSDKEPRLFYGYIIVLLACIILAITWGSMYSFGIFFKPVLLEFGWTRATVSGAYSLAFFLNGFLGIFIGRFTDKFGPRIVVTICGILLATGYLLTSQIGAVWHLYLFYGVLVGIGSSGAYIPAVSTVARWFVKRRGLITGVTMASVGLGTLIVPPITNLLISNYGWRTSFIIIGVVTFVLITLSAQFLKRDPSQIGQRPYGDNIGQEGLGSGYEVFSLYRAIRTKQFWMVSMMFLCFGACVQTIMIHIVPHATDIAISSVNAAIILATIGGVSTASRIILGGASDRIGNKRAITISFIMMFISLGLLLFAKDLWMFYLFAVVFGLAYGGWSALISVIVAELFGLASLGMILGAVIFGATIGDAAAPAVAGWIFDSTGSYQLAFLICAALSLIAVVLALLLKPITNKQVNVTYNCSDMQGDNRGNKSRLACKG
ncbi:MFS transporter [Chloroflexota bacterium]